MDKSTKLAIGGIAFFIAALLVLKIGHAYDRLVFRPDFHGGWWEAMWAGGLLDLEGAMAFARSTAGKLTYLGGGGLLLTGGILFWLALRSDRR